MEISLMQIINLHSLHQKETFYCTSNNDKDSVLSSFIKCRNWNKMHSPSPTPTTPWTHTNCPKEEMPCFGKIYYLQAHKYTEF